MQLRHIRGIWTYETYPPPLTSQQTCGEEYKGIKLDLIT